MSLRPRRAGDRGGTSPPVIAVSPPTLRFDRIPISPTPIALVPDAAGRYWCPWCGQDAPVLDPSAQGGVRDLILAAFAEHEAQHDNSSRS